MKTFWLGSKKEQNELIEYIQTLDIDGGVKVSFEQTVFRRTKKQNDALHVGLRNLATTLNDAGLDMRKVLKPSIDIPWTEKSTKEFLYNPIAVSMDGETSSGLSTKTIQDVWNTLIRHLGEKFGVFVPWPTNDKF